MVKKATKRIAVGALVAGAAGYVAGILTAPKSGKETRKDVKVAASKAKTEAEKQLKKLHSELATTLDKVKGQAGKLKQYANKDLDRAVAGATKAKDKARELLSAMHEGGADDKDLQKAIDEASAAVKHLKTFATKNGKN